MSISYAYRLMKTKNMILQLRSLAKREEEEDKYSSINTSYKFYNNQSSLSRKHKPKKNGKSNEIIPTERMTLRESNVMMIKPIQIYDASKKKSRTTIYNDKEERPISSSNTNIQEGLQLKFKKI